MLAGNRRARREDCWGQNGGSLGDSKVTETYMRKLARALRLRLRQGFHVQSEASCVTTLLMDTAGRYKAREASLPQSQNLLARQKLGEGIPSMAVNSIINGKNDVEVVISCRGERGDGPQSS